MFSTVCVFGIRRQSRFRLLPHPCQCLFVVRRAKCKAWRFLFGESPNVINPLIVVRDGKADHKAKGWAERQSEQSTHVGKGLFPSNVSRSLFASGLCGVTLCATSSSSARLSEEPIAGKPHDGICEGDAGQPAFLPKLAGKIDMWHKCGTLVP